MKTTTPASAKSNQATSLPSLRPLICIGITLLSVLPNAFASNLGTIFPIQAIGPQQLAVRPQGSALFAEAYNSGINYYSELRVSSLAALGTNQSALQGYAMASFSLGSPDVAVNATNGIAVYANYNASFPNEGRYYEVGWFKFDTNGAPASAISNVTEHALNMSSGYPVIVRGDMNRSGRFAVVYSDETAEFQLPLYEEYIYAQLFNADGNSVGPAFVVNQRLIGYWPVVAVTPDGGAIVVWEEASVYGYSYDPGHDIYARRIDANGDPMGSEFRVNTSINGLHSDAEIATATNGCFAIVWTQSSSDADGIYLQRFDADSRRLGTELLVSPYNGTDPQVAMAADGRFVVAWQSQDADGSGIFAQRFLADGSFYGNTLWVSEGATNSETKPLLGLADDRTFIVKWSEGTNNFARWSAWDATNQTQILGPRVQTMSPAVSKAAPITNVTVTFDRLMNPATFATTNAQLIDPVGRIVPVTSVATADNQTFTLNFAPQLLPGRYQVKVGPNIEDGNGSRMDENGNTIKGETTDAFLGQFTLTSSVTAAFPVTEGFEAGPDALTGWSFVSYGSGTVSVVSNNTPHDGTNCLYFNTPPRYGSSQTATLALDLSGQAGQTNLWLEFWAEHGSHLGGDNFFVEQSGDGQTWYQVAQLSLQNNYTDYFFDLDQAAATNGVTLDGDVYIRFRHLSTSSYFADINQFFIDDVRIVAGDVPGPKVIGLTPTQLPGSNSALNSITLTFDKAIDPATFTIADVLLHNPQGGTISSISMTPAIGSGNTQFNVAFPDQTLRGAYRITVGPNIADASGDLMNQNGNNSNGETNDSYAGAVQFVSTVGAGGAAPMLYAETFESWPPVPAYWSFVTFDTGTVSVVNTYAPHGGTNHLYFDTPPRSGSSQSATLALGLSSQAGQTNLWLEFWAEHGSHLGGDNFFVELSGDGQTWYQVAQLSLQNNYTDYSFDLDQAAATNGVTLNGDVYIRFRHLSTSSYFADVNQLFIDDVRIVAGDVLGPKVIGLTPTQLAGSNSALNSITLTFDKAIDPASFTVADVLLHDPQGGTISSVSVTPAIGSGNTQFNVTFPDQTLRGAYRITVGPNIADASGNLMNQNGNNSNGETNDSYVGAVQFVSTVGAGGAAPPLYAETFESWPPVPAYWSFVTFDSGTVSVVNTYAPHGGTNHLYFDTPPRSGSSQSATLALDLSSQAGQTNLWLEFWAKYYLPSAGNFGSWAFYVELSNDGLTWHQLFQAQWNLTSGEVNLRQNYTRYVFALDQTAATNGVDLHGVIYIRFRHLSTDSYFAEINRIFVDDLRVVVGNPNAPVLVSPSFAGNGQFQFQLNGPADSNYVIQASTNLTGWTPIATNVIPAAGFIPITDPDATNYTQRFYRAQSQ